MIHARLRAAAGNAGGIFEPDIDLSTFTEVDPGADIAVSGTRATITTMPRSIDAYLYKDYGVDAFAGDMEVLFEVDTTNLNNDTGSPFCGLATIANTIDDIWNITDFAGVVLYKNGVNAPEMFIRERVSSSNNEVVFSVGEAIYYCKLTRDVSIGANGEMFLGVATSTANRDAETWAYSGTLTMASPPISARYFYAVQSANLSSSGLISTYIDHITLTAS